MSQNQPANPGNGPANPPANTGNNQPAITASAPTSSRTVIPQSAPAGLLTVTQPPQSLTSFYKIAPKQLVTFGWNFSYVLSTPAFLTVSAVANGNTYPVGPTDGVIPGTATEVVWDIYSYQVANPTKPLGEATYVLNIHDERGMGAGRAPGRLVPYSGLQFALYNPQGYTGLSDGEYFLVAHSLEIFTFFLGWLCTTCSGAFSNFYAHPAMVGVFAVIMVMFLSGFGLLRHLR